MNTPELVICRDSDALATRSVDLIVQCACEAVRERGEYTLVLSGGSTPRKTYALLATPDHRAAIDWSRTHVFFSDERLVSAADPRSNFRLAQQTLLSHVPLPSSHCFPIPTLARTAAEAAAAYAEQLEQFFAEHGYQAGRPGARPAALPCFDLILLGLGEDGHVASLFPGSDALEETHAWVTWSPPGTLPPQVDRVTLTYPVLNAAQHVIFLATGEEKAAALRDVLEGHAPPERCPAVGVRPIEGTLTWLVDEEAAKLLSASGRDAMANAHHLLHEERP